jgi:hypothetical protein
MSRPKESKIRSLAQARKMRAAEKLRQALPAPAILSLADLRAALEPLRGNRQVYLQFCGDDDSCLRLAIVSRLRQALRQMVPYPEKASAYLVTGTTREDLNAWPIIWQGAEGTNYFLAAYIDPVRYGFRSQAETFFTIGPPAPMTRKRRQRGLWITYDFVKRRVGFEPIAEEDDP